MGIWRLCTVVCFAFLSSMALAGDVAQLHLHLSSMKTLDAKFKQTVMDDSGNILQQSEGVLAVERPNKIRWESTSPFRYLLVSDGETLWRYDAELEQLNTEAFDTEVAQAPAMIIGASIEQLDAQFDVKLHKQDTLREFTLIPKVPQMFSEMTLRFRQGKLIAMQLSDNLEQRTFIEFVAPKYNTRLPASLFRFDPETAASQ